MYTSEVCLAKEDEPWETRSKDIYNLYTFSPGDTSFTGKKIDGAFQQVWVAFLCNKQGSDSATFMRQGAWVYVCDGQSMARYPDPIGRRSIDRVGPKLNLTV